MMEVQSQLIGDVAVAKLDGRIDAYIAPRITAWLDRTVTTTAKVVVNMGGVNFVDSAALAALVRGMKNTRQAGGDLHLSGLQQPVRIIFELTRFDRAFHIYAQEEEAVAAFAP